MDIGLVRPKTEQQEFAQENSYHANNNPSMMAEHSQQSYPVKKEHEPWRGSSGFGLANILNRTVSSNNSSPPLPKFSLPSLHSFGKPLVTKQDMPVSKTLHNTLVQTLSSTPSLPTESSEQMNSPATHSASDVESVSRKSSPKDAQRKQSAASRRIAPAPNDEEENDGQDEDSSTSIRGGRWSADEHERFLAGFRIHGHKWKRVQQVVRTRSVTQVRTHAQKYLLKVAKLKAEKKQGKSNGGPTTNERYASQKHRNDSDAEASATTAPSTPDGDDTDSRQDSPQSTPRKKIKTQAADMLDEEYISAAATTLCFLMRQKIDSLFDNRVDNDKDWEPYHCYGDQQTAASVAEETYDEASTAQSYAQYEKPPVWH
ncbi:TPA: hypothetical protein N0F65_001231 [Lagenidium giganteum]|uniref:Uncharacterized protein n=1 Tax=Lagenidium giganteum TaxID=4803 RepID=A0AAV2Z4Z2_9STRA|nr:TPA: hypothetical protein N0F65_001231 [Lagenidium giganteum]